VLANPRLDDRAEQANAHGLLGTGLW